MSTGLAPNAFSSARKAACAGALVGALWAAGLDASVLEDELRRLRRADFWDPFPGVGLLRGRLFRKKIESLLPRPAFAGCRATLAVSVFALPESEPEIYNFLSAQGVAAYPDPKRAVRALARMTEYATFLNEREACD